MSVSFTNGVTSVLPLVIDGWDSSRAARNVIQDVFGGGVDAVLYPAAPRSGSLSAVFLALADALAFETMLAGTSVITYADSDTPALGMTFVATDSIAVRRGDESILLPDGTNVFAWSVDFTFQQVS